MVDKLPESHKYIKCDICGSDKCSPVYKRTISFEEEKNPKLYQMTSSYIRKYGDIVKCVQCGQVYINPRLKDEEIKKVYRELIDKEYIKEPTGREINADRVLSKIEKYTKNGKILDLGCATGFLLKTAHNHGWDVYGVEPSVWASEYVRNELKLENIYCSDLQEANFPDNFFDVIVVMDFIEHICSPLQTMKIVDKIMKKGGILYITTPDIKSLCARILGSTWWFLNVPHLFYFSKKTIKQLLNLNNFEIIEYNSLSRTFSLEYFVFRIKNFSNLIHKIMSVIIKIFNWEHKLVSLNLGDQLEIVARKK